MQKNKMGAIYVVTAAILWSITGVIGQHLSQQDGFDPGWVVAMRMLLSGAILVGVDLFRKGKEVFSIFTSKRSMKSLLIFTAFGSGMVQVSYFYAVSTSNAATATFLQYLSPAIVVVAVAVMNREEPSKTEIMCMLLAIMGTFLIATHGSIYNLSLSATALLWGLASAVSLAFYTVYPQKLMLNYGFSIILGWSFLIGGIILTLLLQPWKLAHHFTPRSVAMLIFLVVCGTVVAFLIYAIGVNAIGAPKANILATIEPLVSAILSAMLLNTRFEIMDYLGFICILSITFILAIPSGIRNKKIIDAAKTHG